MALAEHRGNFLTAQLGDNLKFRTGRLDNLNLRFCAIIGKREVFRPHPVYSGASVVAGSCGGKRKFHACWPLETGGAIKADRAFDHVHCPRTDEAADEPDAWPLKRSERRTQLRVQPVMQYDQTVVQSHCF